MRLSSILPACLALVSAVAATSELLLPRSPALLKRQMPCSCIELSFATEACRQCTLTSTSCECPTSVVLDCQTQLSTCSNPLDEFQSQCDSVFCMADGASGGSPGSGGGNSECETGYELCGDGCMPQGRVCCSHLATSCPAGTTCPATGGEGTDCLTGETDSGDDQDDQQDGDDDEEEQATPSASTGSPSSPSTTPKADSSAHGVATQGLWSHVGLVGTAAFMVLSCLL